MALSARWIKNVNGVADAQYAQYCEEYLKQSMHWVSRIIILGISTFYQATTESLNN